MCDIRNMNGYDATEHSNFGKYYKQYLEGYNSDVEDHCGYSCFQLGKKNAWMLGYYDAHGAQYNG